MRAFVLCTGRCGSTTFQTACDVMSNYTAGHETRARKTSGRLDYPDQHIEVDNRLAWFLGGLESRYGDDPVYVHLRRDPEATAKSYSNRFYDTGGFMRGFGYGIISRTPVSSINGADRLQTSRLLVATITENIEAFLANKSKVIDIHIEQPHAGFDELWDMLGAEGDRRLGHVELKRRYNRAPRNLPTNNTRRKRRARRAVSKR